MPRGDGVWWDPQGGGKKECAYAGRIDRHHSVRRGTVGNRTSA